MIGDILWITYGTMALIALRPIAGHLAWYYYKHSSFNFGNKTPNQEQWFAGIVVACLIVCAWPAVLVWHVIGKRVKIGAEREAALNQREETLKQKEIDAGIRDRYGEYIN